MITEQAKRVIDQILSVFETGKPTGGYDTISILPDGAGFTGGKHQATDGGGALDTIVLQYITVGGKFANEFKAFTPKLAANESRSIHPKAPPPWAVDFMALWRKAATEDLIFGQVQDDVFNGVYWAPCVQQSKSMGLTMPLSYAAIYDTCIQSGPGGVSTIRYRKTFPELPPARGGNEVMFIRAYLREREAFLANFVSPYMGSKGASHSAIVRRTVYRPQALTALAINGDWNLDAPLTLVMPPKLRPVKVILPG